MTFFNTRNLKKNHQYKMFYNKLHSFYFELIFDFLCLFLSLFLYYSFITDMLFLPTEILCMVMEYAQNINCKFVCKTLFTLFTNHLTFFEIDLIFNIALTKEFFLIPLQIVEKLMTETDWFSWYSSYDKTCFSLLDTHIIHYILALIDNQFFDDYTSLIIIYSSHDINFFLLGHAARLGNTSICNCIISNINFEFDSFDDTLLMDIVLYLKSDVFVNHYVYTRFIDKLNSATQIRDDIVTRLLINSFRHDNFNDMRDCISFFQIDNRFCSFRTDNIIQFALIHTKYEQLFAFIGFIASDHQDVQLDTLSYSLDYIDKHFNHTS